MTFTEGGTELLHSIRIHYMSDTNADYVAGLKANTLERLADHVRTYRRVAEDAWQIVRNMTPDDFKEWRRGLAKDRKGEFAGEEFAIKYGAVLMPEILMRVAMIAQHFGAPWGCAYIRCRDMGHIKESGGIAKWAAEQHKGEHDA